MTISLSDIIKRGVNYNLHTHTEYCDGRNTISEIAAAAVEAKMHTLGFTPHSPLKISSPCNMSEKDVDNYIKQLDCEQEKYDGILNVMRSMEIDYLDESWGCHIDYFQKLPLDYRLASVHFVPNQGGIFIDCDGSADRFIKNLREQFNGDLRYVVEKFFEQNLNMLESGGFDILGHFDKIAANACIVNPEIEREYWYAALIEDIISHAASSGIAVEINTKKYESSGRFFPSARWWPRLLNSGISLVVNSDAHYSDKLNSGRNEAYKALRLLQNNSSPRNEESYHNLI